MWALVKSLTHTRTQCNDIYGTHTYVCMCRKQSLSACSEQAETECACTSDIKPRLHYNCKTCTLIDKVRWDKGKGDNWKLKAHSPQLTTQCWHWNCKRKRSPSAALSPLPVPCAAALAGTAVGLTQTLVSSAFSLWTSATCNAHQHPWWLLARLALRTDVQCMHVCLYVYMDVRIQITTRRRRRRKPIQVRTDI